jgi:capsular polysaccharide transport system permease protein
MSKPKKRRSFPWLFLLLVVLPTVLATVYFYRYASDQYVSEAHFIIQGTSGARVDVLGALTGLPGAGGATSDAMIVQDYLKSADFIKDVSGDIDIRAHYSNPAIDEYARLKADASQEELVKYWQKMIDIEHDLTSGISTLQITAFDPQTGEQLVILALKQSESLVNKLSSSLRTDTLQMAEKEKATAEQEVNRLRQQLTQFRQQQDVLDPGSQASARMEREETARLTRLSELQTQLSAAEAELAQASTFMQPEALKVKALQSKVNSIRQQVTKEQAASVVQSKGKSTEVAGQLAQYNELQSRLGFAEQMYKTKESVLEQARLEADRKQRYLTVTVKPNLPDEAIKPEKLTGILTVLLLSFLFWGIGSLSVAAIRDHVGWV